MKNHIKVDGKLLQTNKKWSHLKNSQRSWISEVTKEEHTTYVAEHGHLPMKKRKEDVLDRVHSRIVERGIWIPYREFRSHVSVYIDRLNHKSPLFTPPKKKSAVQKPKTPRGNFEDFPAEVQEEMKKSIVTGVERYIGQSHRIPPNKVRDSEIKQLIRGFNAKRWKEYGMLMQSSDVMLHIYNEVREEIYAGYSDTGVIPQKISASQRERLRNQSVVLETDRLILRKMTTRDYMEVREMLADPEVMYSWERTFTTKKEVTEWIIRQLRRYEKDLVGYFAAVEKERGRIIGQIGLMWNDIQGRRCLEVGYILNKAYWHKGYATEGAKACVEYGFELFGVDKIYTTIRSENLPSIAVAERIGMVPEGEYIKKSDGKPMKHLIYACTKK